MRRAASNIAIIPAGEQLGDRPPAHGVGLVAADDPRERVAPQVVGLEAGLELETLAFAAAFATRDAREGIDAFLAKPPPKFEAE